MQQANTGDDGKVGISAFDTTATKMYTQNMDGKFYCELVQYQLKLSMAQTPKKINLLFNKP